MSVRVLRYHSLKDLGDGFVKVGYLDIDKDEGFVWIIPKRCIKEIKVGEIVVKQPCEGMEGYYYPLYEW